MQIINVPSETELDPILDEQGLILLDDLDITLQSAIAKEIILIEDDEVNDIDFINFDRKARKQKWKLIQQMWLFEESKEDCIVGEVLFKIKHSQWLKIKYIR